MEENKKRLKLYIIITFVLTFAYEILVVWPIAKDPERQSMLAMHEMIAMFMPTISVIIVRIITKEGFRDTYLALNLKGNIHHYVFAWFAPTLLTIIGAIIFFLIFPDQFDIDMGYIINQYKTMGLEIETEELQAMIGTQVANGIFVAPLLNLVPCFGEEFGWRAYLLPKMKKHFSIGQTLILSGIIWGLWHAPLIYIGHNYGVDYTGYPVMGILAMCIFCIVLGIIFSYLTIKTQSVFPAALAHGAINGFAMVGTYFTTDGGNPFVGPSVTGIIGGSALIVCAIICFIILCKQNKQEVES